jgi:hypothetical protein
MKVEFWNTAYKGAPSKLVEIQEWPDTEESFKKFYHKNNELRYCNGCHYSFVDPEVRRNYLKFVETYHTIENYYRDGVVD